MGNKRERGGGNWKVLKDGSPKKQSCYAGHKPIDSDVNGSILGIYLFMLTSLF